MNSRFFCLPIVSYFSSLCTYPSQCADSHEHAHSFLQDAETTKLLNCSHHLSACRYWSSLERFFHVSTRKSAAANITLYIYEAPNESYKWLWLLWSLYVYFVVPVITGGGATLHCWVHHVVRLEQNEWVILYLLNHCLESIQIQLCLISHVNVSTIFKSAIPRFACGYLVLWK